MSLTLGSAAVVQPSNQSSPAWQLAHQVDTGLDQLVKQLTKQGAPQQTIQLAETAEADVDRLEKMLKHPNRFSSQQAHQQAHLVDTDLDQLAKLLTKQSASQQLIQATQNLEASVDRLEKMLKK